MKKQLQEELVTLAEKIISRSKREDISTAHLKELTRQLYEKLTVLDFTQSNLFASEEKKEEKAEIVKTSQEVKAPAKKKEETSGVVKTAQSVKAPSEQEEDLFTASDEEYAPSGLEFNDSEAITEPNTEKIKDIVAQMPAETQDLDDLFESIQPRKYQKNDMEDIGGVHYDNLPKFEPVGTGQSPSEKPRSLNERLKKGINIGVNDRHAFVRHLFDGSTTDYNRVLSQLNTIKSKEEALNFVANMVKPDYNNWEGKEDYETRFLTIIESRFE
ncbi:hypothetical protein [Salinimicrobium flavum]|uniref:Uncharacterized protein n=1 Tax=Salinimicrobium flavum TaxID=1737065 RepID=A0ABW5IUE3_9FLAO